MDYADWIAYFVVGLILFGIIFLLTGIQKKVEANIDIGKGDDKHSNTESEASTEKAPIKGPAKQKKKKRTWVRLLVSLLLTLAIAIISQPLTYKLTNLVIGATNHAQEAIAGFIRVPLSELSQPQESDRTTGQEYTIPYNGENKIDVSLELADRALIPEWSQYRNENMVAVDVWDSRRAANGGYQGARGSSEDVTYAFTADREDAEGLFTELESEILHNPYYMDMLVQEIAPVFKGEDWIQEFLQKTEESFQNKTGITIWYAAYEFSDGQIGLYVTDEYRGYAEKLCRLLEGFENRGVQIRNINRFYYSPPVVMLDQMRTEMRNDPMTVEALVLSLGEYEICFDLNDKAICT